MQAILAGVGRQATVNSVIGSVALFERGGHRVTMLANDHFARAIQQAGLHFQSIGTEEAFRFAFSDPDIWHWAKYWRLVCERLIGPALLPTYQAIEAAYVPGETVAVGNHLALGALLARDKLGVPTSSLIVTTTILRGTDRPPLMHPLFWQGGGPAAARWQYWWMDKLAADPADAGAACPAPSPVGPAPGQARDARWALSGDQVIAMFPEWFMPHDRGWPARTKLTGFPLVDLSEQSEMDESLATFLDAGPPPIVFTPGSAMNFGKRFFEESAAACRLLKCRGVFVSAYGVTCHHGCRRKFTTRPMSPIRSCFRACGPWCSMRNRHEQHRPGRGRATGLLFHRGTISTSKPARIAQLGAGEWMWNWQYRGSRIAQKLSRLMGSPEVARACREAAERIQRAPDALELACREIEKLAPRPGSPRRGEARAARKTIHIAVSPEPNAARCESSRGGQRGTTRPQPLCRSYDEACPHPPCPTR